MVFYVKRKYFIINKFWHFNLWKVATYPIRAQQKIIICKPFTLANQTSTLFLCSKSVPNPVNKQIKSLVGIWNSTGVGDFN